MRSIFCAWYLLLAIVLSACGEPEPLEAGKVTDGVPVSTGNSSSGQTETPTTETPTTETPTTGVTLTVPVLQTATPGDAQVSLAWSAVDGATTYTLYYSTSTISDLSQAQSIVRTVNSATVTALINGTAYFFAVTANTSTASSALSNSLSATPVLATTVSSAPTTLVAVPKDAAADLSWDAVMGANSYNLYHATESFDSLNTIANYATLSGGTLVQNLSNNSHSLANLVNGTTYYVVVTAVNAVGESAKSAVVSVKPVMAVDLSGVKSLNDTGLIFSANMPDGQLTPSQLHNVDCSGALAAYQDCASGRDVSESDDTDGVLGFSFTKLSSTGAALDVSASSWSCVKDNVTGLVWEAKQGGNGNKGDQGLHDVDDIFSWYNPDISVNGRDSGAENSQPLSCHAYTANTPSSYCNTLAFVERVNTAALCGLTNWRLPNTNELLGLVNFGADTPSIETTFFPNMITNSKYWSNGTDPENTSSHKAWTVLFNITDAYQITNGSLIISESKQGGRPTILVSDGS
jgi:hypothetical protein